MPLALKTNRLLLSPIAVRDVNAIHQLHSLPEVDKYNTLGIPKTIQDTETLFNHWITKKNAWF